MHKVLTGGTQKQSHNQVNTWKVSLLKHRHAMIEKPAQDGTMKPSSTEAGSSLKCCHFHATQPTVSVLGSSPGHVQSKVSGCPSTSTVFVHVW